jgi:truncated hemoglobin YjbI
MSKRKATLENIYKHVGKADDIYKAVTQLYKRIMKSPRRKWVLSMIPK